jgi:hypothetical protein
VDDRAIADVARMLVVDRSEDQIDLFLRGGPNYGLVGPWDTSGSMYVVPGTGIEPVRPFRNPGF